MEEQQQSRFRDFIRAFWPNWFALMSGGPSVPAAMSALYVDELWAKIALWITAFTCLVLSAYFVWRPERKKIIELHDKISPKITCSFSADIHGCIENTPEQLVYPQPALANGTATVVLQTRAIARFQPAIKWYRIRVINTGRDILPQCYGRLLSIIKDGAEKPAFDGGEPVELPIVPPLPGTNGRKNLHYDTPEFLDVFCIDAENKVHICGLFLAESRDLSKIIEEHGEYIFTIRVLSSSLPTYTDAKLSLHWTGDINTVKVAWKS
jgi:hypothetical protein